MKKTAWLPGGWRHPQRVELSTGHHLRPIRAEDVDLDMVAVLGSRERLWGLYGASWGWPPATLTVIVKGEIYKLRDNLYGATGWYDGDPVATVELPVERVP